MGTISKYIINIIYQDSVKPSNFSIMNRSDQHCSSFVSALASGARAQKLDPNSQRGKVSVSEHGFDSVICRDDTK